MNVKWKGGTASYTLTKPEMKTLADAAALIEQVSNVKGPIGEKAEAAAKLLKEMMDMLGAQTRAPERAQLPFEEVLPV